jgi:serine/threonine-protein kinase
MSPTSVYPPGTTINDRYQLVVKVGTDGSVYRAHDRNLDKQVAIKFLHPKNGYAQPWDEAQRLEHLRSRFLLDVINADVVLSSDIRFIVTPIHEQGDLESEARPNGIASHDAVRYVQQIASGVDRIHAAGMVHRDIKPSNVLLDGDGIVVSDLEFCEILDAEGRASRNGSFCTVAPETAADDGYCSVLSDVYSLAATAFYLFSGEYPVDHRHPRAEQQRLIISGRIRELRVIAPHTSRAVAAVIRKAMRLDPAGRFPSAESFANSLVQAARDSRNWRRVEHVGHTHCLEGSVTRNRSAVAICSVRSSGRIEVSARMQSGRRISGIRDIVATDRNLAKVLQGLVKTLQ